MVINHEPLKEKLIFNGAIFYVTVNTMGIQIPVNQNLDLSKHQAFTYTVMFQMVKSCVIGLDHLNSVQKDNTVKITCYLCKPIMFHMGIRRI